MKVDVLLGLQWGDDGKGKVVDVLTPKYDLVTRFQGGPNAGHTLEFNGEKYVLRSIPSGIFQGGKVNIIGNGVVLDPLLFKQEAEALAASGHDLTQRLYISKKAHLIMPTHRMLDAAYEAAKGSGKIGTTGKGIGPTYTDKISRNGLRVGDTLYNFQEKYAIAKEKHEKILRSLNYEYDITGRKRRCGWIDLVALRYAVMINGVTKLIMMKSDVMDSFETIKACVAYKLNDGTITEDFPFDITEGVEPIYEELPGWKTDMTKMTNENEFPEEYNAYLSFLEEQLQVPIKIVSVGPDREQTIVRYED
jgi:adenylosuccinate synthase